MWNIFKRKPKYTDEEIAEIKRRLEMLERLERLKSKKDKIIKLTCKKKYDIMET